MKNPRQSNQRGRRLYGTTLTMNSLQKILYTGGVGSTWFRIKRVNSQCQALSVGYLWANSTQRAIMNDPGEAFA
eukprot:4528703-Prorocentrum_lima.AAC.1